MIVLPYEMIYLILNKLDIIEIKKLLFINKYIHPVALDVITKKRNAFINNLLTQTNNELKILYCNHYHIHIENYKIYRVNKLLQLYLENNIFDNIALHLTPDILSFFIFEWVGLKGQGFDDSQIKDIEYCVSKYRGKKDYSDKIDYLNNLYCKLCKHNSNLIDLILVYF